MISSDIGIIGYGSAQYHKSPNKTALGYASEAMRDALMRAGVGHCNVDGLVVDGSLGGDNSVSAAEYLGVTASWVHKSTSAGAGTIMSVVNAIRAVDAGLASLVVCIGAGAQNVASFKSRISSYTGAVSDYLAPHGYGGPPGMHAIIQKKHMREYGTQCRQIGRIAVDQRYNAVRNESALLRKPLSLDEYLGARLIADPLRLYDCVMPCSGAEAVVVGPLDLVEAGKRVVMSSACEQHNYAPGVISPIKGGWGSFQEALFGAAGYTHKEMHFMQCYDDFPIVAALQIEDLGFCDKGEVGEFLDRNRVTFDGSFPLNTGGGQLSCGQAGGGAGMLSIVEAVRQLRHEGHARQVAGAARGIVSGYGVISYGHGLSATAAILERQ